MRIKGVPTKANTFSQETLSLLICYKLSYIQRLQISRFKQDFVIHTLPSDPYGQHDALWFLLNPEHIV